MSKHYILHGGIIKGGAFDSPLFDNISFQITTQKDHLAGDASNVVMLHILVP